MSTTTDYETPFPDSIWQKARLSRVLEAGHVADFFHESDARLFIGQVSVRNEGALDVTATSKKLRLPIEYQEMHGQGRYVPRISYGSGVKPRIELQPGLPNESHVFGHEVGHHFLHEILGVGYNLVSGPHNDISEAFCEFFGYEMVDPGALSPAEVELAAKAQYHIPDDYEAHIERLMIGTDWVQHYESL